MKNILIIDDNKLNLATARKVLSDEYKVIPVIRGEQALTYLKNGDCDIILLDINMPEMDGFEVLKRIREMEHCKNTPVIFLTADDDSETETRCFKEGAIDFIAKPFVPEVMRSRVGRALELEELRRSLARRLEQKTREISDMKNKSFQDALTGLWNRVYTEETVNNLISQGIPGTLMMIDLDNFKAINDNYGHIAGDHTLQMFADTLRKFSGEEDILCRIGGDEFIVYIKDVTDKNEIGSRAADIILDLCHKLEECKFETNCSVSIGIAQFPEDGKEFNKLYNCADKALYYVKQNGKNAYHFFSDKLQTENNRGKKNVDLNYLCEFMNRGDNGKGVYSVDFESFHHVYNFIRRFVERSERDVQTLLFTLTEKDGQNLDVTETEIALELLEKAICLSLRRSDVSTRYSSKQIIVILMDANEENGDMVAGRILKCFQELYTGGKIEVDYGIARMDGEELF
ncbi:MAG: diguanylate cyclase [Eubacterium sp.]|nr:diguanylate cyclase [Eubacterium sp.]